MRQSSAPYGKPKRPPSGQSVRIAVVAEEQTPIGWTAAEIGAPWRLRRIAPNAIDDLSGWAPHLVLVDERLSASMVRKIQELRRPTILLTEDYDAPILSRCLSEQLSTCIARDASWHEVAALLEREHRCHKANEQDGQRRSTPPLRLALFDERSAMDAIWRLAMRAASTAASVLVTGETGTGKEVVARAIHRFSARRAGPFVPINCAAVTKTLLEAELFGHEKGAFTGAASQKPGRFEVANGGTLFLDEVGELSPSVQAKLLRVLQEREFERVGGTTTLRVDVRILAATNRNLEEDIHTGRFRADLFYRLNVLNIHISPVRERKEDLLALWEHFVRDAAMLEGRQVPLTPVSIHRRLLRHAWPGNIREIQNAAHRAVTMCTAPELSVLDLPWALRGARNETPGPDLRGMSIKEVERAAIMQTCAASENLNEAAEILGISLRKIHYRMKQYRNQGMLDKDEPHRNDRQQYHGMTVLIAEDDDELRGALTEFLESRGCNVTSVGNGTAVLEHVGAATLFRDKVPRPHLILTDHRLQDLNGLGVLESLRGCGWSAPVAIMSAYCDEALRDGAEALGAFALLEKPFDPHVLEEVLDRVRASSSLTPDSPQTPH